MLLTEEAEAAALSDDDLLDRFQRGAFGYFTETVHARNGLVPDTSRPGAPASIAVVGFALACWPVGVERGWMARGDAAALTLACLRFLNEAEQSRSAEATGYKGFFYHFLDRETGRRAWRCELSMIDTALLMAGVLTAGAYFTGDAAAEAEIRELAEALYRRVDWRWAQSNKPTIRQGWRPRRGFLRYGWEGYNEATILYVLAMASPDHPLAAQAYAGWTETYRWEKLYGRELLYGGPLFMDQFSHAWIDFSGIRDAFMREHDSDYFENSRRATYLHRDYARHNPEGFAGYGENLWGLSASDGPGRFRMSVKGRRRKFMDYAARGCPFGPDDGTLSPPACLASLPFAPEIVLAAMRHLLARHPEIVRNFRLPSGFNPTLGKRRGFGPRGWVSEGFYGLDQGVVVLMIENFRSGLLWRLMRSSAPIRDGLKAAGFEGGWLGEP